MNKTNRDILITKSYYFRLVVRPTELPELNTKPTFGHHKFIQIVFKNGSTESSANCESTARSLKTKVKSPSIDTSFTKHNPKS